MYQLQGGVHEQADEAERPDGARQRAQGGCMGAHAAFLQGLFLGALGIGVLATTAYRVLVLNQPEVEIIGLFGVVALAETVVSAAVLLPHRTGDANVRAVWLFSHNDAIGNVAVVIAAALVAWTGTP